MTARLRVVAAGPLVTFQDAGRPGHMRFGVPASGPMDRLSHATANRAIGNDSGATAIEVSIGGLTLEATDGAITVAVTGGGFTVEHNGAARSSWQALTLRAGDQLRVAAGAVGSWAYVAMAGEMEAASWLGHTATHSISGLGGGAIAAGSEINVGNPGVRVDCEGVIPELDPPRQTEPVRVVLGPQTRHFDPAGIASITSATYHFSSAFDRMGVRLDGPTIALLGALSIPSEPIVRGSIQVDGSGVPSLLFADHQTTGGYPKIATVISPDLDRCSQKRPGDPVRFVAVEPPDAITAARSHAQRCAEYLNLVAGPGRTLSHRLASQNLIGGVQP